jgi:hypothetical protein
MSLDNENKTNLLFKNFQGVTQGSIVTSDTGGATYSTEPFKSLTGIFQNQIYSEDVPLTLQQTLRQMQNDSNIASSIWNTTTNNARDQILSITQLLDEKGNNLPLAFYKDVYLDKMGANNQAWWLIEPNKPLSTENNVLSDTIPWKYNDVISSTYTPIVTYWKDSTSSWAENGQNDTSLLNWGMNYSSGILVCYQSESTLEEYTVWSSTSVTEDKKRPRISFIKYIGAKGAAASSSSDSSNTNTLKTGYNSNNVFVQTQDVSAIYFDSNYFDVSYVIHGASISLRTDILNEISSGTNVDATLSNYFFNVPDSCSNGNGLLTPGSALEIDLSWNLPPTYKTALPIGSTLTYDTNGVIQTTNIDYLPYFKELKIEYKDWSTNSDPTQGWTDLSMSGSTTQPIIPPSVNSAHIGASNITSKPILYDLSGQTNSTPFTTYQNLGALEVGGQYQFRVYLVNDSIQTGITDPIYGGEVPYNYHYIPDISGGFISLGEPGGPTPPTSISFQFTNLFNTFSSSSTTDNAIIGYNSDISGADISLNIPFSGTGQNQTIQSNYGITLQFNYQIDASSIPISSVIQMPYVRTSYPSIMSKTITGPSPSGLSNTILTTTSDLATSGIEWYPEYNYVISNFSMESFDSQGSLGVSSALDSAYGTDSSFVSIIPSRYDAGSKTERIASNLDVSLSAVPNKYLYDAYPFYNTNIINDIYFLDVFDTPIKFEMDVFDVSGANNLDPQDSTLLRGIDSSGVDLTSFRFDVIDGSTNNIRYTATTPRLQGYLNVDIADISDSRFGLFTSSIEGSKDNKAQGYYTDVIITKNAEIRDVSLESFPDICNNNYEPYIFRITDNYRNGMTNTFIDGNTLETQVNIARQPLFDISYMNENITIPTLPLTHSFFGLKMPEVGGTPISIQLSYELDKLDPYWKPSTVIAKNTITYDPSGIANLDISSQDIEWNFP